MSLSNEKIGLYKEFVLEMIKTTKHYNEIKNLLNELYVKLDTIMTKEPIATDRKITEVSGERAAKSDVNSGNWAPPFNDEESDDSDDIPPLVNLPPPPQSEEKTSYFVRSLALNNQTLHKRDFDEKGSAPLPN